MKRIALLLIIIFFGLSLLPQAVGASDTATPKSMSDTCIDPQQDIPRQNGISVPQKEATVFGNLSYDREKQALTITYSNVSDEDDLWIDITTKHYDRSVRVTNTSGFKDFSSDIGYSFEWDGETQSPKLTLTATNQLETQGEEVGYATTPNWGFLPIPSHSADTHLRLSGEGFVGDQFILTGSNNVYETSSGCQTIRVIVPEAAKVSEPPKDIIESLRSASSDLDIGPRYSRVNAFVLTDPIRRGGAANIHEFWVHNSSTFEIDSEYRGGVIPSNTWLHEYTHTRQLFLTNSYTRIGRNMVWITEASASYYAVELTTRQQYAGPCEYTRYFWATSRTRIGPVVLRNPDRWGPNNKGQYRKGALVLSALDQRIRNETNGRRTLDDVMYRVNTYDGRVTYEEFKQIVETTAGTELDEWLDEMVTTSEYPEPGLRKSACRWQLTKEELLHTSKGQLLLLIFGLTITAAGYRIRQWYGK